MLTPIAFHSAFVDRLIEVHLANVDRLLGVLDLAERDTLGRLLAKLAAGLET